jgi:hypothetical protein
MKTSSLSPFQLLLSGSLVLAAGYGICAGVTWLRFGLRSHAAQARGANTMDDLMPVYDVEERWCLPVHAPAERTFAAACSLVMLQSGVIRAIFTLRQLVLGSRQYEERCSLGLVEQAKAWGWRVVATTPGQEIAFGGATQPWIAEPVFKGLSAQTFRAFDEPGYVKIIWNLRVDGKGARDSIAITETRALATDKTARAKFRRYWALVAPGTALIRLIALYRVKKIAERETANLA